MGPSDEEIACADPEKRKQWNKDAYARQALERLRAFAQARYNDLDLQTREYGTLLCQFSDGSFETGPIAEGPAVQHPDGTAVHFEDGRAVRAD